MGYLEQSLGGNEVILYRARFPTIRYWLAWAVLALLIFVAYLPAQRGATASACMLLLMALAAFIPIMYRVWTTEIGVTNQRLVYSRGLIRRSANDLQLSAIEEVRLVQDFFGRIFNYGRIEVRGTGLDDLELPALGDPVAIQKALQQAIGSRAASQVAPITISEPANQIR